MAGNMGRIRYRRNIIPPVMRQGERIVDVKSGFLKYTIRCVPYRGGWTDRNLGPDVNPKTDGYLK